MLKKFAKTKSGRIVFPSGAEYRLLVLPTVETMALLDKIEGLVRAGATVVGNPPRKSPSVFQKSIRHAWHMALIRQPNPFPFRLPSII